MIRVYFTTVIVTRYRRDNSAFRASIARKCKPTVHKLSLWQTCIVGLVVNVVKVYCLLLAGFGWIGSKVARE